MITIDIHPNLFSGDLVGSFVVSWHGFLTFIAVLVAVVLVGRWAPMKGIDSDAIYSIAIWAIIGGIIGARLVHVIDNWDIYQDDPAQILAVWSGGIGLWGGIPRRIHRWSDVCLLRQASSWSDSRLDCARPAVRAVHRAPSATSLMASIARNPSTSFSGCAG